MDSECTFSNPEPPPTIEDGPSTSEADSVPNTTFSKQFIRAVLADSYDHFLASSASCSEENNADFLEQLGVFAEIFADSNVRSFVRNPDEECGEMLQRITDKMGASLASDGHPRCEVAVNFLRCLQLLADDDFESLPVDHTSLCTLALACLDWMEPSMLEATYAVLLQLAKRGMYTDVLVDVMCSAYTVQSVQFILTNSLRPKLCSSVWQFLASIIDCSHVSQGDYQPVRLYYPMLTDVFFAYDSVELPTLLAYARIVLTASQCGADVPVELTNAVQSAMTQNLDELCDNPEKIDLYEECLAVYNRFAKKAS